MDINARTYANALAAAASEMRPTQLRQEIQKTRYCLVGSSVQQVLKNPDLTTEQADKLFGFIADQLKLSKPIHSLLKVLNMHKALNKLARIEDELEKMALHSGDHRLIVTSAAPLNDEQYKRIEADIERIVDEDVHLETEVDQRLLGGLRIQLDGQVIDHTYINRIKKLLVSF